MVQSVDGARVLGLVADTVVVELWLSKWAIRVVRGMAGLGLLVLGEASPLCTVVLLLQPAILVVNLYQTRLTSSRDGIGHHVQVLETGTRRVGDRHHLLPHHDAVLGPRLSRLLLARVAGPALLEDALALPERGLDLDRVDINVFVSSSSIRATMARLRLRVPLLHRMRPSCRHLSSRTSRQRCRSTVLRALGRPKVLIGVSPLRHRRLGTAWAGDLVRCPGRSQILVVLLLHVVIGWLVLLESLRARRLLGVRSHLLVWSPEEQLVRILWLRGQLGMVVLADLQAVRGGERWLERAGRM